jgi:predicted Zn-dependent protease
LAIAQLMIGDNDAAIKAALNAKAANPMNSDPYLTMAYALKGDRVKASAAAAELLSIDPSFRSSSWLQQVPPEVTMPSSYLDYERRVFKPALRLARLP